MKPNLPSMSGLAAAALWLSVSTALAAGGLSAPGVANNRALGATSGQIVLAQADPGSKMLELEEQVRGLNGRVEDLTFQLLQLQEQLRKMQEDNEFRFQELEGGKRGALPDVGKSAAQAPEADAPAPDATEPAPGKLQPPEQDANAQSLGGNDATVPEQGGAANPPLTADGVEMYQGPPAQPGENGLQPRTLGTLIFDENGNVVDAAPGPPVDLSGTKVQPGELAPLGGAVEPTQLPAVPDEQAASLAKPEDPAQLYELGYGYVQAGNYKQAEVTFREFTERYAKHPKMGEASFWHGESVFAQQRYEEAAKIFLDTHKKYPKNRMGAQNLFKLGVSLAGMKQRELACATFAEVPKKYPNLSNTVSAKVAAEQKAASCLTN